eukprot:scaffold4963_cov93-Skeletonema_marinoi.AAC.3
MQLHIEEVAVSFEGRGADGCDTLIYNCEADEWGSPSSVDKVVDDASCVTQLDKDQRISIDGKEYVGTGIHNGPAVTS